MRAWLSPILEIERKDIYTPTPIFKCKEEIKPDTAFFGNYKNHTLTALLVEQEASSTIEEKARQIKGDVLKYISRKGPKCYTLSYSSIT